MHLYVFGNGNLSFQAFLERYAEPLGRLQHDPALRVLVCDFRGVDTLVMEYLKCSTPNVRVYHVGERPRYLPDAFRTMVSRWELVVGFDGDGARDAAAIAACTHFLAHDETRTRSGRAAPSGTSSAASSWARRASCLRPPPHLRHQGRSAPLR